MTGTPTRPDDSAATASWPSHAHRGWHSRGYLPHFDSPDQVQSITIRLDDAIPEKLVEVWRLELGWIEDLPARDEREVELRRRIARYEDAGHGSCFLRDDRVASLVQGALLHFDGVRYHLAAWCVMPNHVHVMIETTAGHPLDRVVHSWKSFTASKGNRILGRQGSFWFRDYHDRYVRDANHYSRALAYVEENPVRAGLAAKPEEWRFGSAYLRAKQVAD